MAVIEFRTLGTLGLRRSDGTELHSLLAQPKRVALLAYLCVAKPRGFHRRDTLLGLFWPDADQAHARTSLRNALHVLRQSVGENAIRSRGDEEVSVNFESVWCDAVAFEDQATSDRVDNALELYRGDFLSGFFLDEVPAFERWLEVERSRLRVIAARAARTAAEKSESALHVTDAVNLARRAVDLTDTDERAVRRLIELLARVGDRAGALQAYGDFERRLAGEFGGEPSPETRALFERLRSQKPNSASIIEERDRTLPAEPAGSLEPNIPGYKIEREIGRGGMATVFLAHDLKHSRPVAIKFLRPDIALLLGTDRFLAEIAIAARLHHPHILPLLDSGTANGLPYYVMPYCHGETLRQRLRKEGFFPIDEAVRITCEVAEALVSAHGQGVIHRDIKPENVLLDNDHAVVSDFGIARALCEAGGEQLTQSGLAVGTPAYMSPEQAKEGAITVDARTDIYALACVLYEMLMGDPPFAGSTAQAVLARKAAEPAPPMRTVRDTIPPSLERNVLKALSRVPADRFATAKDFADAIKSSQPRTGDLSSIPRATTRWRPQAFQIGAISVAAIALVVAVLEFGGARSQPESRRVAARQVTYSGKAFRAAISPDGQFLAYAVAEGDSQHVMVQDIASDGAPKTVAVITNATTLEWSPDGSQLLFGSFDGARSRGLAFTVPRSGGEKRGIGAASAMPANVWAHWIPDSLGGSSQVSLHTDTDTRVLIVDLRTEDTVPMPVRGNYDSPYAGSWSPRGNLFAVAMKSVKPIQSVIGVVGRDGQLQIAVEDSIALGSPRWSPTGDALYYARGTTSIWRVPVSAVTGKRTGAPTEINRQLEILVRTFYQAPDFALTRDASRMAYASGRRYANIWMVRPGQPSAPILLTTGTALRWSPVVSPDGRWVAFAQDAAGTAELFRMPIAGGVPERITFGARVKNPSSIAWSPDGKSIAFGSVRGGRSQVWIAAVDGGQARVLTQTSLSPYTAHLTWAPAAEIAYLNSPHNHVDIVDPESGVVRTIIPAHRWSVLQSPQYSPDGKKLAVAWNRGAGDFGVWIFDAAGSAPGKKIAERWLWPSGWSPDGRYVYANVYNAPTLYRLDTTGERTPEVVVKPAIAWRGSQQNIPVREMQCTPAGRLQRDAYICAAFDFVSDIWIVDNFQTSRD